MKKKKKVQPSKPKPGRKAQNQKSELLTSLGVPLRARGDSEWALDLSNLKLFTGLSVIARLIGDEILDQSRAGQVDIVVQRRVIAEITPELTELGITGISIYALDDVLRGLPSYQQQFHNQIRTVFGTLQRPRWGSILFPELFPGANKKEHENALLFPFHLHSEEEDIDYFFLVERDSTRGFVRITIERDKGSRINLKSVKAITVDDLDRRTYLQGLTRITESVYLGIQRECENYHNEYMDNARRHGHFFEQLHRVGLTECESITVRWPQEMTGYLVRGPSAEITITLKRALIVLEDKQVVERLLKGDSILMTSNGQKAWLDLSRRGRGLNLSLHQKREAANLEYYLERMPDLEAISLKHPNAFKNMRIFLIHHITGEILGTIRALENMGMSEISVLYVKYAGVVPADYLEALLSLPDNRFHFYGLQKIETHQEIEGHYILSRQYSDISRLIDLDVELDRRRHAFFEAMNYAAGHLFLREALQAREHGERILLIEDGGYLGPTLNQFCLENKTLGDALKHFGVRVTSEGSAAKQNKSAGTAQPAGRRKRSANIDLESVIPMLYCSDADLRKPLYEWLRGLLPATVEHTRNGYNRLEAVQEKFKKLAFPAASIAVSNIKREGESREVSISILHAIESILHGLGRVFSQRRVLVLGSCGAIGRNLMEDLAAKIGAENLLGVDVVADGKRKWLETQSISKLPERELYNIDMIIGVIGISVLTEAKIEKLIIHNRRREIYFASGSTKTAEFTHLSQWLQKLQKQSKPTIQKIPVELDVTPVRDPQTRHIVGSRVRIFFNPGSDQAQFNHLKGTFRDLYLLGGLTPINFLFYGVPTETMDSILAQLLQVAAGTVTRLQEGVRLPARLLAVDHQVDPDGNLLK